MLGCWLTTPHKLQAEARSRKRGRRRLVVLTPSKPMAEACQLHAVVRQLVLLAWGQCVAPLSLQKGVACLACRALERKADLEVPVLDGSRCVTG